MTSSNSFTRRTLIKAGFAAPVATVAVGAAGMAFAMADGSPAPSGGDTAIVDKDLDGAKTVEATGASEDNPELEDTEAKVVAGYVTMAAASWSGEDPDVVEFQGIGLDDALGEWVNAELLTDIGEKATDAVWLGESKGVHVRAYRDGVDVSQELTLHTIATSESSKDDALTPTGGTMLGRPIRTEFNPGTYAPAFIPRIEWGANEKIGKNPDLYEGFKSVVIHHTAGTNNYTASQSAQLVRGIQSYHTQTLGWADLGYNALVDKYGQVFEGRRGGLENMVQGAHCYAYNTGTFGISVMGNYSSIAPSAIALQRVAEVAAWRLHGAFIESARATSTFTNITKASNVRKSGTVTMPVIFGHRDANYTACPGDAFYKQFDRLRTLTATFMSKKSTAHLQAFKAAGGEANLGTVTTIQQSIDKYWVTRLTNGIIITEGLITRAFVSQFGNSWEPSWGMPLGSSSSNTQRFLNGIATNSNGKITFKPQHIAPFTDIAPTRYNAPEINTIYYKGILSPYPSDKTLRPANSISRIGFVDILYKAVGSPSVALPARSPFSDLKPTDWGYKSAVWALNNNYGIFWDNQDGTKRFRPNNRISRKHAVQWLYDATKSTHAKPTRAPYSDVPASHLFATEIAWAKSLRLVKTSSFAPDLFTSRQDAAVFAYRWMASAGKL